LMFYSSGLNYIDRNTFKRVAEGVIDNSFPTKTLIMWVFGLLFIVEGKSSMSISFQTLQIT
jgi:hypothetical protein